MNCFIVLDSCGELTGEMKAAGCFASAPLSIEVDGYHIVDDETFDQKDFLRRAAASPNAPRSACPSPEAYRDLFDREADHIFAVTLSAELSGSYNSAMLGRELALEKHPERNIYVFNSRSASVGETLIGLKIYELEQQGLSFSEVIEQVEDYIADQKTWFVLESLEALRKNGRLTGLKAKMATVLNIKPVMMATPSGTITQLSQARGINKALRLMVEHIAETAENTEEKLLAISHCNCPDRARMVREALLERIRVKEVIILDTGGISSLYASDGGIIVVI